MYASPLTIADGFTASTAVTLFSYTAQYISLGGGGDPVDLGMPPEDSAAVLSLLVSVWRHQAQGESDQLHRQDPDGHWLALSLSPTLTFLEPVLTRGCHTAQVLNV